MAGSKSPGTENAAPAGMMGRRIRVRVHGIVQGVGFRPFIFQLAERYELGGWVRNHSDGVEMEVSGSNGKVEAFVRDISEKAPPLSRIVGLDVSEELFEPLGGFRILESSDQKARRTLIAPDVATCPDCLRELLDPQNRRYLYPFTNCTNCGPRYTIIQDIPYDRCKTTMAAFAMCSECRAEYENPSNRRFHAQPNACRECGPHVWLEPAGDAAAIAEREGAVREVIRLLQSGAIVAIKGLGGFHLAVDALNEDAVSRLRGRKIREEKPFAVMFSDLEAVREHCRVSQAEARLVESPQRPIVLLERIAEGTAPPIAPSVAPRTKFLGVFLPYTPLHHLLLHGSASPKALVMTSANKSDEPIVTGNEDARERLRDIADFFLLHNRDIFMRCDDSVVRVLDGKPRPIRRARGYAPAPVFLKEAVPSVLGVGAELKSTVCLTRGKEAFLSQHIGDLENLETLHSFEKSIAHLEHILEIRPELVVHDLHPDYLSTGWAYRREQNLPRLGVQHHHAHIAAVMAEQHISGPVLGVALDGTGYGTDGTVWGGEILRVDGERFERLGHLRQVSLPGGDKAVREPWRMAVSYLWSIDPLGFAQRFKKILDRWSPEKVRLLTQMIERGLHSPLTSSCGRLFDAVSSILSVRDTINYEGQAAIELEQAIEPDEGCYHGEVKKREGIWVLDAFPLVLEVVADVEKGTPTGVVSARFHNGVAGLVAEAVFVAGRETGLHRVALSGGVFQNAYLSHRLESELAGGGVDVYSHSEVPSNDACIALGQAYIGALHLQREKEA